MVAVEGGGVAGVADADGAEHEVASGVFGGDEFDDFGVVAHDFQEEGAEGVGDDVGEALMEDAVVVNGGEVGNVEAGVEEFVAAGDGEEESGVGADGLGEGVVGGGVAGVEGEDDVRREVGDGADGGLAEFDAEVGEEGGAGLGFGDDFGVLVDADDAGGEVLQVEEVGRGEGEEGGPAAAVEDEQFRRRPRDCDPWVFGEYFGEDVVEEFEELIDLGEFVAHGGADVVVSIEDAEGGEEGVGAAFGEEEGFGAVEIHSEHITSILVRIVNYNNEYISGYILGRKYL